MIESYKGIQLKKKSLAVNSGNLFFRKRLQLATKPIQ